MLSFTRTLVAIAVNISLNYLLIPIFGPTGAAFATLIAFIIAYFAFDFFSRPMRRIFWMKMKALRLSGLLFRQSQRSDTKSGPHH